MGLFEPPNVKKMEAKKDVGGLIKALSYWKDKNVRNDAATALGKIGDTRAVEPLIRALDDKDQDVCKEAASALETLGVPQGIAAAAAYRESMVGRLVRYRLTATCLDNPLDLEVATEKFCVYCAHLRDPAYPKGVGECSNYGISKSVVSFDDICEHWTANTKVRFWLSKGYMENNLEGWPRRPWYQVFDDGPDGEKGTRG